MNKVELADQIACLLMDEHFKGDPWMEENKDGDYVIKKEYQSRFNDYYDEVLTLIENSNGSIN